MNEHEKTAVSNPSAPTDGRQPLNNSNAIISEPKLTFNGKFINPIETIDGKSLLEKELPPIKFIIDNILPQGLFILGGSPKVGKSWLSLDFCQTVATGGQTWDCRAEKGSVLYLALEDSLNRLQSRLKKYTDEGIPDLHFGIRALKIQDGLVAQVQDFIRIHPDTSLIIIDTMQHIRNNANDKNAYVSDYRDMNLLREITNQFNVALILVTHTRKMDDPDPLNMISGSTGLVGAVDGVFILEKELRTANSGKLTISNRDTEGFVFLIEFDNETCHWHFVEQETTEEKEEPLYKFISDYLSEKKNWSGTATELCATLSEEFTDFSYTPPSISKRLKAGQNILKNKYSVTCLLAKKNNIKIIEIYK